MSVSGMNVSETDLDPSDPDAISAQEAETLLRWYATTHGEGNLDLTRFVPFLLEHRPAAFKRLRRHMQVIRTGDDGLPLFAVALLVLHSYVLTGYERGIFYEIIAARDWGATKAEVLDTIQVAFLDAGPFGANAVAALAEDYLRAWEEPAGEAPAREEDWPAGWAVAEPGTYETGLDHSRMELSEEERAGVLAWYERRGEEVPAWVTFLAAHHPRALKTHRARIEQALGGAQLPQQLLALFRVASGVVLRQPARARAGAEQARRTGVTKGQLLEALGWALLAVDEDAMNAVARELDPLLRDWS